MFSSTEMLEKLLQSISDNACRCTVIEIFFVMVQQQVYKTSKLLLLWEKCPFSEVQCFSKNILCQGTQNVGYWVFFLPQEGGWRLQSQVRLGVCVLCVQGAAAV